MIRRYIKNKLKVITGYLLIAATFLVVCSLYQMDNLIQVFYAVIITSFLGFCYGIYDYAKTIRHYNRLREILHNPEEIKDLPEAEGILQEMYQGILVKMQEELRHSLSARKIREKDIMDYYLMWAHQIKTPIAAMKLLIRNEKDQDNGFALSREMFKVETYVEMALHYLRLESIASDTLLKEYDLYSLVKNAVKKYSLLFINNKITLDLQQFDITVVTDEKWFSFVLEQVLSNALKYTQAGKVTIYMEAEKLVIADTGIGIMEEDLPRIFDRGFTGYNGRMDKKATGIGLYLSKQIADRLGIGIEAGSVQGKGTWVLLDLSDLTKV